MEKKAYVSPAVEMMEMEAQSMMAQSVTSNLDGLKDFKGDASRQDRHPGSRRQQEQRLGLVVTLPQAFGPDPLIRVLFES